MTQQNPNIDPTDVPPAAASDLPHAPPDDSEQVYFEGSPLVRASFGRMFLHFLICIALILLPFFWMRVFPTHHVPGWLIAVFILVGLVQLVIPWLMTQSISYRITNYRIDYKRGLLSRSVDSLELWHVDHIGWHQSFFQRIMGVGDIDVRARDDQERELKLIGLPNPEPLFRSLEQRIIAVKRQRGVVKMDTGS